MRGATGERWRALCEQGQAEQDPEKFLALIEEITRLLEAKEESLQREVKGGLSTP